MYIVYKINSTMEERRHATQAAAKATVTRLNKKAGSVEYAYTNPENYYENVVYLVERVNALTGVPFMEPSNVPYYCSASSESYWSN